MKTITLSSVFNSFMTKVPSYRNQFIDLQSKSMNWFLYNRDLRHERVNTYIGGRENHKNVYMNKQFNNNFKIIII